MATPNFQALKPAPQPTDRPLVMRRSYEGFLRWVSVEALAELCEEAAQAKGFTEPYSRAEIKAIMFHAYEIHLDRSYRKRRDHSNDVSARRRARKLNTTVEHFTRAEIIARDDSTCYLCGKRCAPDEIHLDHVIPLSKGGPHTRDNLRVACAPCNIRKADTLPSDALVYPQPT